MARTNLPLTALVANSAILNQAGTAVDQVNGMNIQIPTTGIPATGNIERLVLYVQNTGAGAQTVIVRKGVGGGATPGAAFESGKGDLTTGNLTATTGTAFVGPFEVARFLQADGSVNIDFSANLAGTVWAIMVPRAF